MDKDVNYGVCFIIFLVIVSIVVGIVVLEKYSPPETIEKNGYTYTLYEAPPEEYIEYNGHTYRLESKENVENL